MNEELKPTEVLSAVERLAEEKKNNLTSPKRINHGAITTPAKMADIIRGGEVGSGRNV